MNFSRHVFAMVAGLGLLSAGCLSAGDDMNAEAVDALPSNVLTDPLSHTGTNNLDHNAFRNGRYALRQAMSMPLIVNNALNPSIVSLMCNDTAKRETFKYAMACALPEGYSVSCGGDITPLNHSPILSNTGDWPSATLGLSTAVQEEVLACVATHVNAFDYEVEIVLSGAHVNDDELGLGDNTIPEATWTATSSLTGIAIEVWPSTELSLLCGNNQFLLEYIIKARVCGIEPDYCFLNPQEDPTDCVAAQDTIGTYTCNSKTAITSWLTPRDMLDIYAGCIQ